MRDQTLQKQGDSDPGATAVSGEAESRVLTVNPATTPDDYAGGGYGLAWRDLEGIDRDINAPPGLQPRQCQSLARALAEPA